MFSALCTDGDCGDHGLCFGARCHAGCASPADCTREGYGCVNGYCAPALIDAGVLDQAIDEGSRDLTTRDLATADARALDLGMRDLALPDLALPDLALPDLALPDLALPDLAMPDLAIPDLAIPDLAMPDLAIPDLATRDLSALDLAGGNFNPATALRCAQRFGGAGNEISGGVAIDGAGNIIFAGAFSSASIDFGDGPHTNIGNTDVYVAKFDSSCAILWSKTFGSTDGEGAAAVAVDRNGDIYLLGSMITGAIDFGGGPLPSPGANGGGFFVELGPQGDYLRGFTYGGPNTTLVQADVAVALDGSSAITGYVVGTVDFGGGPLTSNGNAPDAYLARFDAAGKLQWSRVYGDASDQRGGAVAFDAAGNLLVGGGNSGQIDFGGGAIGGGSYVAKLDPAGKLIWNRAFPGLTINGANVQSKEVLVDPSGDVIVTGAFFGSGDLGNGVLTSNGGTDVPLLKLDGATGSSRWSELFGDNLNQVANGAAVDGFGNIVLTGYMVGSVDFGGGKITSNGGLDFFRAAFDRNGHYLDAAHYGNALDQSYSQIAVSPTGEVVLVGPLQGTIDFGGGPLVSAGADDVFLAAFVPGGPPPPDMAMLPDLTVLPDLVSSGPVVFGNPLAFADGAPTNVGDFDGDGKLDLIASFFWHGNGDGTFTKGAVNGLGAQYQVDLNHDGKLDLVVGTNDNANVLPYLGQGDGTFTAAAPVSWPNMLLSGKLCGVADFDGDKVPDLAVVVRQPPFLQQGETLLAAGNGDGTFAPWHDTGAVSSPPAGKTDGVCAVADLDADGAQDLFLFTTQMGEAAQYGDGKGAFPRSDGTQASGYVVAAGAFDGSGRTNMLMLGYDLSLDFSNRYLEIFLNPHTPKVVITYPGGDSPTGMPVIVGDFTGDGKLDLFAPTIAVNMAHQPPGMALLVGNGDGSFQPPVDYPAVKSYHCNLAGDFNQDGKLDLACSGRVLLQQ